ncbi:hypothetical protein QBC34DRAFT_378441 [Podospora aff. communis PSN243]|uniref:Uncharacterized protein n=1 Tax=Podospora aff. communis PSN243 TaxID=3040156 RepID=A0AAV9GX38_9PEZI|nr:hypothetical protein QBC34DRAFT_378441 [Podospora aff. communis PSN243]
MNDTSATLNLPSHVAEAVAAAKRLWKTIHDAELKIQEEEASVREERIRYDRVVSETREIIAQAEAQQQASLDRLQGRKEAAQLLRDEAALNEDNLRETLRSLQVRVESVGSSLAEVGLDGFLDVEEESVTGSGESAPSPGSDADSFQSRALPADLEERKTLCLSQDDDNQIYDQVFHPLPHPNFRVVSLSEIVSALPADFVSRETWARALSDCRYKLTPEFLAARLHYLWTASRSLEEPQEALQGSLDERVRIVTRELCRDDQSCSLLRVGHAQACYHLAALHNERWPIIKERLGDPGAGNPEHRAKAAARVEFTTAFLAARGIIDTPQARNKADARIKRELAFGTRLEEMLRAFNAANAGDNRAAVSPVLLALLPLQDLGQPLGKRDTSQVPAFVLDWVADRIVLDPKVRSFLTRLCDLAEQYVDSAVIITRITENPVAGPVRDPLRHFENGLHEVLRTAGCQSTPKYPRVLCDEVDVVDVMLVVWGLDSVGRVIFPAEGDDETPVRATLGEIRDLGIGRVRDTLAYKVLHLYNASDRCVIVDWDWLAVAAVDMQDRQTLWHEWPQDVDSVVTLYPYSKDHRHGRQHVSLAVIVFSQNQTWAHIFLTEDPERGGQVSTESIRSTLEACIPEQITTELTVVTPGPKWNSEPTFHALLHGVSFLTMGRMWPCPVTKGESAKFLRHSHRVLMWPFVDDEEEHQG